MSDLNNATTIRVGNVEIGNHLPLTVIAGPCQMESRDHAMMMAESIKTITDRLGMSFIFKTSFDKANRSSLDTKRGVGIEASLPVYEEVKKSFDCPVLADVHTEAQCPILAEVIDVLQIPAFLCRQTDLVVAAAKTGRVIKIKKGQFMAPWDMAPIIKKVTAQGNPNVMLTDRGTSFGYNTLVSDMRSLPIMAQTGAPVIFDATHSVQQPGGLGGASGGQREFVAPLARAAVAVGVAGVFIETHENPDCAPSDGPCMLPLHQLEALLLDLQAIDNLQKEKKHLTQDA